MHRRCHAYVSFSCQGLDKGRGTTQEGVRQHNFVVNTYTSPSFCDQCGSILYGILRQGLKCKACDFNVHKKCQENVPDLCGCDHHERRGRLKIRLSIETSHDDSNKTPSVSPSTSSSQILVCDIKEAKNLIPMDPNGFSDPYVKVKLLPESKSSPIKRKTKVVKSSLNPVWDESLLLDLHPTDKDRRILIEVWDWDRTSRNDFMGCMSFGISEVKKQPVEGWFKLLSEEEGEFYNVPVLPEDEDLIEHLKKSMVHDSAANNCERDEDVLDNGKSWSRDVDRVDNYTFLKVLGKGSFGKVLLAESKKDPRLLFAIKVLKKDVLIQDDDTEAAMTEKRVLALKAKPPFLVGLHSCFQGPDHLFFVMEFVSGGDLMYQIQKQNKFKEPVVVFYAAEIAIGLFFLHKRGIAYRDLKLDNILLDQEGHVKIGQSCTLLIYLRHQLLSFIFSFRVRLFFSYVCVDVCVDPRDPQDTKGSFSRRCATWLSYLLLFLCLIFIFVTALFMRKQEEKDRCLSYVKRLLVFPLLFPVPCVSSLCSSVSWSSSFFSFS